MGCDKVYIYIFGVLFVRWLFRGCKGGGHAKRTKLAVGIRKRPKGKQINTSPSKNAEGLILTQNTWGGERDVACSSDIKHVIIIVARVCKGSVFADIGDRAFFK